MGYVYIQPLALRALHETTVVWITAGANKK